MATLRMGGGSRIPIEEKRPWQSWATFALGAWVFITPWLIGDFLFHSSVSAWTIGAIVCFVSLWVLASPRAAALEWINAVAGLYLLTTPFWLPQTGADRINNWICGALILAFAAVTAFRAAPRRGAA